MTAFENKNFAEGYNAHRKIPEKAWRFYSNRIKHVISDNKLKCIADAGAGSGLFSRIFDFPDIDKVYAIEPASEIFKKLLLETEKNPRIECINDKIPTSDALYDVDAVWASDILHLFDSPFNYAEGIGKSFPNAKYAIIRQTSPTLLSLADWAEFFPRALELDTPRHHEVGAMIAGFEERGWSVKSTILVNENYELSGKEYLEYYSSKPFSGMHLISKDEFDNGIKNIENIISRNDIYQRKIFRWCYEFYR